MTRREVMSCMLAVIELDRGAAKDQDAGALDFKYKFDAGSGLDVTSELTYRNATFIYGWTAQTVMAREHG
jgi:hypothetical protein